VKSRYISKPKAHQPRHFEGRGGKSSIEPSTTQEGSEACNKDPGSQRRHYQVASVPPGIQELPPPIPRPFGCTMARLFGCTLTRLFGCTLTRLATYTAHDDQTVGYYTPGQLPEAQGMKLMNMKQGNRKSAPMCLRSLGTLHHCVEKARQGSGVG
jgi:hypothetical protein